MVSKQLLPVYDKPMIYYPLSMLMLAGIRDILIISTPQTCPAFERLLGDGSRLGLSLSYAEQPRPRGSPRPSSSAEDSSAAARCLDPGRQHLLRPGFVESLQRRPRSSTGGALVFGYRVKDPERYGVVEFDADGHGLSHRGEAGRRRGPTTPFPASTSTTTGGARSPPS